MSLKNCCFTIVCLITLLSFAQESLYTSFSIPENLKKNANAIVRESSINITLKSSSEMHVVEKRIITVLNKQGNNNIDAYEYYDNNERIIELEAIIYDAFGRQIDKIKKKDFKDVSAVSGGTLYSDSRVKFLEYTPISYPYTIEYISEKINKNTAFIQSFYPLSSYYLSVESSSYSISFPQDITIRTKEKNFKDIDFNKEELPNKISFNVKNIKALKKEDYSPNFSVMAPRVMVASNQFALEGVKTEVKNWNDFGKWIYDDLIKSTQDLPDETRVIMQNLVKNETDDIKKAKKVYQYVQDKVRYISVQVGIGGWKPFNVSKVDQLGYGDCKALTNYTMALLDAVGVESYYTVVYARGSQRSIEKDFTAMQGNHVILNIPREDGEDIWLECTSQKVPFGFIGDFTDDRDVLVITPEGGKIKHTKKYTTEENSQTLKGSYALLGTGDIIAEVNLSSKGIQYDDKYSVESYEPRDKDMAYKKRWRYLNSIDFEEIQIKNDKDNIQFNEHLKFTAKNYSKKAGNRILFVINALNRSRSVPDRYKNRMLPLKINRGFMDTDEVEVKLPEGYTVESFPKKTSIQNKFGSYHMEIIAQNDGILKYKRTFVINDGEFPKENYNAFRAFYKEVSKLDNAKVALIKSN